MASLAEAKSTRSLRVKRIVPIPPGLRLATRRPPWPSSCRPPSFAQISAVPSHYGEHASAHGENLIALVKRVSRRLRVRRNRFGAYAATHVYHNHARRCDVGYARASAIRRRRSAAVPARRPCHADSSWDATHRPLRAWVVGVFLAWDSLCDDENVPISQGLRAKRPMSQAQVLGFGLTTISTRRLGAHQPLFVPRGYMFFADPCGLDAARRDALTDQQPRTDSRPARGFWIRSRVDLDGGSPRSSSTRATSRSFPSRAATTNARWRRNSSAPVSVITQ